MSAAPTPYVPSYNFTGFQVTNPDTPLPAQKVDNELNNISTTTKQTINRLAQIQRNDGQLQNSIVTLSSLSPEVLSLMSASFQYRGTWVTGTFYAYKDFWTDATTGKTYVVINASGYTSGASVAIDVASGNVAQFNAPNAVESQPWIFDVTAYGAAGDGLADDYNAINDAKDALLNYGAGGILYFPPNKTYRITTAADAIHFDQFSDFTILFDQNASLLIDNLDGSGNGNYHGILVTGPCSDIRIIGAHVKYVSLPTNRGVVAPFYFRGANVGTGDNSAPNGWVRGAANGTETPSAILSGAVSNILMENCISENSPSVFVGIVGVDGITNINFTGNDSWADGLYHLYFRRAQGRGIRLFNVGDDAISMSSYESDLTNANIENTFHGEGSNYSDVYVENTLNSNPSGAVVILGVRDVVFGNIVVNGKYAAVRISYGTQISLGFPNLNLNFLAPRRIIIQGVTMTNFTQGISIVSTENNFATNSKWWKSEIFICDVLGNSGEVPINIFGLGTGQIDGGLCAGFTFKNLRFTNYSSLFTTISQIYNCKFDGLYFDNIVTIYGSVPYSGDPDAVDGSGNLLWADNLCDFLNIQAQTLVFQGLKRCNIEDAFSLNAPTTGITISSCGDISFGTIRVTYYNRTASALATGVFIDQFCKRIMGNVIDVDTDATVGDSVSIISTVQNFIKYIKTRTKNTGFFNNVNDILYNSTKVSQIERVDWINLGTMTAWLTINYPNDPTAIFGDANGDLFLHTQAYTARYVSVLTANRTLTVHEDLAAIGDTVNVARLASATGAFTLTIQGQGLATPAVAESLAIGSFVVNGGAVSTDTFDAITVNGVPLLGTGVRVPWNTSNSQTAADIATQINFGTVSHHYTATALRQQVTLTAAVGTGATPNGQTVAVTTFANAKATAITNMHGGVTAASAGSTPSPYTIVTGGSGASGKFATLRYTYPLTGNPRWEYTQGTM